MVRGVLRPGLAGVSDPDDMDRGRVGRLAVERGEWIWRVAHDRTCGVCAGPIVPGQSCGLVEVEGSAVWVCPPCVHECMGHLVREGA